MKRFRLDNGYWETAVKILFIFRIYKYQRWERGQTITKWRLFKIRGAEYFHFKPFATIEIGRKEFDEKYQGNKWLVPVNYALNTSLP